jgi:hypothetical protein
MTTTTWQSFWERLRERSDVRVERTQYKRIQAPMLCRSGGLMLFAEYHHGGTGARVRVYSDDPYKEGQLVEIALESSDEPLVVRAKVRWVDSLPGEQPARFDVGMDVLPLSLQDLQRLEQVLV